MVTKLIQALDHYDNVTAGYPVAPKPDCFRRNVPLPPGLTLEQISAAMDNTQRVILIVNRTLAENGFQPLSNYMQMNNFGGIISNTFTDALGNASPYKCNSLNKYPDLLDAETGIGIEIKTANKPGKGGESHNGHGGWHLVACYDLAKETGNIQFCHVMIAELIGYDRGEIDWHFCRSTNVGGRTRHIETYYTTGRGTQKLRDGSIYLDETIVPEWRRWKVYRGDYEIPPYSPFYDLRDTRRAGRARDFE